MSYTSVDVAVNSSSGYYVPADQSGYNGQLHSYGGKLYFTTNPETVKPIGDVYLIKQFEEKAKDLGSIETLTIDSIVNQAKELFGINVVQIAEISGVSRATLYNHMSQKETPSSMESYQRLAEITKAVKGVVKTDIRLGLKSILVDGKTLLAYLRDRQTSTETMVSVCRQIETKLSKIQIKRPSLEAQKQAIRDNSILG